MPITKYTCFLLSHLNAGTGMHSFLTSIQSEAVYADM